MSDESTLTNAGSRGRSKWLLLGFCLVLVGLVVGALWWPRAEVFEVNGVPFRLWIARHPDTLIEEPLAGVGTNAIPHFIRIIREPAVPVRVFEAKAWIWTHLPRRLQDRFYRWYPTPQWQLKRTALLALSFLGPEAKAALPDILRAGRAEANRMVQTAELAAALKIAPESPDTFQFWRDLWNGTNYSRNELAIYLRSARYPMTAAAPLLLEEARRSTNRVTLLEAFEFLGEAARPAVPLMLQEFHEVTYSGNMMEIFRRLGPVASETVPEMAALLKADNPPSSWALEVLKAIGPEAESALPAIQLLVTNRDPTIRMLAASASARIQNKPELAVPVLLELLEKPLSPTTQSYMTVDIRQPLGRFATAGPEAAAILLGECGPAARSALPALERTLQDKNQKVRVASAQAIWRISGSASNALPALLAVLDSQPQPSQGQSSPANNYTLVRAIEAIEEMGPGAKDAIPSLRRVRSFSIPVRHAVDAALLSSQEAR